jgi:DnaK suppressor protein
MAAKKAASKPKKPAASFGRKAVAGKPAARKAAPAAARKPAHSAHPAHPAHSAHSAHPARAAQPSKSVAKPAAAPKAPEKDRKEPKSVLAIATMKSPPAPVAPPADDLDGSEPSSLLAGPRNVKPYIAKRGERYMNQVQLEHFQTILKSWKRDLMMEVDRTVTHMKDEAANFPDPNDRATQEEEFSLELRTRDRERKLIRKIDEALKRAEDGTYGYCLETGEEIGVKRLEARPVATLTIEAQERRERRERQYGDRDDRYR